jgi:hypothetical protein
MFRVIQCGFQCAETSSLNELGPFLLIRLCNSAQPHKDPKQADNHAEDVRDQRKEHNSDKPRLSIAHVVLLAAFRDDRGQGDAVVVARPPGVPRGALQRGGHVVGDGKRQVG